MCNILMLGEAANIKRVTGKGIVILEGLPCRLGL